MNAIGYVRVSSQDQAQEGISLEAQQTRIRAYCDMMGLTLADVIVDPAVSAFKPLCKRDGGQVLLQAIRQGHCQAVVAVKLDRLFRNVIDCLAMVDQWDKGGIALHLLDLGGQSLDTSSAMGRFFLGVMAGIAELERGLTGERTKVALNHLRAQGKKTGGSVPYGFVVDDEGYLQPHEEEQAMVQHIMQMRAQGLSYQKIADSGQFKNRQGNPIHMQQVWSIVKYQEKLTRGVV